VILAGWFWVAYEQVAMPIRWKVAERVIDEDIAEQVKELERVKQKTK